MFVNAKCTKIWNDKKSQMMLQYLSVFQILYTTYMGHTFSMNSVSLYQHIIIM